METEKAREMIDRQLDSLGQAMEAGRSEELARFLSVMGRFRRYSLGNVLLVMLQNPDATHVAGFHAWKEAGRSVRKGEKGIAILAPMMVKRKDGEPRPSPDRREDGDEPDRALRFRVVYVFDVAQTEGEDLPTLARPAGDPGAHAERLRGLARQLGIALEYDDRLGGADGASFGGRIALREGLAPGEEFAVLAHELAHEILHQGKGEGSTRARRELEAEAVACVVAEAVGLDSRRASADYIALYGGGRDGLLRSLEGIRSAATTILDGVLD